MSKLLIEKAVLVYQGGIAHVFKVKNFNLTGDNGRDAKTLCCGEYRIAAAFAKGMGLAGTKVRTMACNMAEDITYMTWSEDLESHPFYPDFIIVSHN